MVPKSSRFFGNFIHYFKLCQLDAHHCQRHHQFAPLHLWKETDSVQKHEISVWNYPSIGNCGCCAKATFTLSIFLSFCLGKCLDLHCNFVIFLNDLPHWLLDYFENFFRQAEEKRWISFSYPDTGFPGFK